MSLGKCFKVRLEQAACLAEITVSFIYMKLRKIQILTLEHFNVCFRRKVSSPFLLSLRESAAAVRYLLLGTC